MGIYKDLHCPRKADPTHSQPNPSKSFPAILETDCLLTTLQNAIPPPLLEQQSFNQLNQALYKEQEMKKTQNQKHGSANENSAGDTQDGLLRDQHIADSNQSQSESLNEYLCLNYTKKQLHEYCRKNNLNRPGLTRLNKDKLVEHLIKIGFIPSDTTETLANAQPASNSDNSNDVTNINNLSEEMTNKINDMGDEVVSYISRIQRQHSYQPSSELLITSTSHLPITQHSQPGNGYASMPNQYRLPAPIKINNTSAVSQKEPSPQLKPNEVSKSSQFEPLSPRSSKIALSRQHMASSFPAINVTTTSCQNETSPPPVTTENPVPIHQTSATVSPATTQPCNDIASQTTENTVPIHQTSVTDSPATTQPYNNGASQTTENTVPIHQTSVTDSPPTKQPCNDIASQHLYQCAMSDLTDRVEKIEEMISYFLSKIEKVNNAAYIPPNERQQQIEYRLFALEEKMEELISHHHSPASSNMVTSKSQAGAVLRRSQESSTQPQTSVSTGKQSETICTTQLSTKPDQYAKAGIQPYSNTPTKNIQAVSAPPPPKEQCTLLLGDDSFTVLKTTDLNTTCKVRTLKGADIHCIQRWIQQKLPFTPTNCIIYAGLLDIHKNNPEEVIDKFGTLVSELKNLNENMKICVCPLANTFNEDKMRDKITSLNAHIAQWTKDNGLFSINLPQKLSINNERHALTYQNQNGHLNRMGVFQLLSALANQLNSFEEEIKWKEFESDIYSKDKPQEGQTSEPHITKLSSSHRSTPNPRSRNGPTNTQPSIQNRPLLPNPQSSKENSTQRYATSQRENQDQNNHWERQAREIFNASNKHPQGPRGERSTDRSHPYPPPLLNLSTKGPHNRDRTASRKHTRHQPMHPYPPHQTQDTSVPHSSQNTFHSHHSTRNNGYVADTYTNGLFGSYGPRSTFYNQEDVEGYELHDRNWENRCSEATQRYQRETRHKSLNQSNSSYVHNRGIETIENEPIVSYNNFPQYRKKIGCFNCGEFNHRQLNCRYDYKLRCTNCQLHGHKHRLCNYYNS